MKKPTRAQFGHTRESGWLHGDLTAYLSAMEQYESTPRNPGGRKRTTPVHESWNEYLIHFNPSDPTRSQGAFCRWLGIHPTTFSAAKRKPITTELEQAINEWVKE